MKETKKEKDTKRVLYRSNMDDIIDMSNVFSTALAIQLVGLPTSCPTRRVFFEDAESAITFARIYMTLANTGEGLSAETVDKVLRYLKEKDYRSIIHKEIRFSEENDAEYALWPQFSRKKKAEKKESLQMSLFDMLPGGAM